MTHRLFYDDAYIEKFTARVLSCTTADGKYRAVLDKTAFFPEGGGQPGDKGFIGGVRVLDTVESGEEIIHICEGEIAEGEYECTLDFAARFINMQQHTGEHVFSGIIHRLTGLDNVGFHMGSQAVTVDFNGEVDAEILEQAERESNEAVYANIPVEVLLPTAEELESFDYRSKKELSGQVRLVKIGGYDLCACCGTHVARTGEIGIIKVVDVMNYKQGVRITLQIGKKAVEDYDKKLNSVRKISALLCAKPNEVAEATVKLEESMRAIKSELSAMRRRLFARMCNEIESGTSVCIFEENLEANEVRELCDMLCGKAGVAAVFSGAEGAYKYAVGSRDTDIREIGKKLNELCNGRGGGKPQMVQGSVCSTREKIEEVFALFTNCTE